MINHNQLNTFYNFIIVQSGGYVSSDNKEETEKNRIEAKRISDYVKRFTRYAYGLARNQMIIEDIVKTIKDIERNEEFLNSEVLNADGTPITLFKIRIDDFPGWKDQSESGIVYPQDFAFLSSIGVLDDSSEKVK